IATNMAGRGTDIKLGEGVKDTGGLAIVGTERHESRRVDRQLRGRSGRQGDPGSSQFFVSLEDDLMRLFGSERISGLMVKMGIEDGEVIQHSMITKSIERAQKKVEENNFGIRKRLLEYDDVMNSQRTVIYTRRKNALFGERLDVDLNNTIFDVTEDVVTEYKDANNFEGFQLEMIRLFSVDTAITAEDFAGKNSTTLVETAFHEITDFYKRKSEAIAKQAYPVLKDVYDTRGNMIENIIVPFTDGIHGIQVAVPLQKAIENDGHEVLKSFEKNVVLTFIDDAWKEHLREMDELKQSVQNAVYEQKDPLLVYKFEAFQLFRQMLTNVNKEIVSFLFKGGIPVQQQPEEIREAKPEPKLDMRQMRVSKPQLVHETNGVPDEDTRELQKPTPVKVEQKIGRNDPCPCGSGKKYKNCHGVGSA
ncbi:MAG: preprotein translocase subunit SecA, partial [Sphingobacteriaceae bacterium]